MTFPTCRAKREGSSGEQVAELHPEGAIRYARSGLVPATTSAAAALPYGASRTPLTRESHPLGLIADSFLMNRYGAEGWGSHLMSPTLHPLLQDF